MNNSTDTLFLLTLKTNNVKVDDPQDFTYVLVQWPESQVIMDYDWFDSEASLADSDKFGSSAYFIPQARWLEINTNN